jgi:hypothetical protein
VKQQSDQKRLVSKIDVNHETASPVLVNETYPQTPWNGIGSIFGQNELINTASSTDSIYRHEDGLTLRSFGSISSHSKKRPLLQAA